LLHIASPLTFSAEDISRYVNSNLEVANFIEASDSRLFYFSTNNVYPLGKCFEDEEPKPESIYSYTKLIAEDYFRAVTGEKCSVLRIGDVYGLGQKHGNFFRQLEYATRNNTDFKLMGSGQKSRSQIWINDLVDVILDLVLLEKVQPILNVATYEPMSNLDIVESWEKYFHRKAQRVQYSQEDISFRQLLSRNPIPQLQLDPFDSLRRYFETLEAAIA